jgi:hypothetical protein
MSFQRFPTDRPNGSGVNGHIETIPDKARERDRRNQATRPNQN